jgi:folate-binding protein YgfZ
VTSDPLRILEHKFARTGAAFAQGFGALEHGAAVALRPGEVILELGGKAALDYLHRMLTQDLRTLVRGQGARGCLLDVRGRTLGDFLVWQRAKGLWLTGAAGSEVDALPVLERYVLADDVTFTDRRHDHARVVLAGPRAPAVLRAIGLVPPAPGGLAGAEGVAWFRTWVGDAPVFEGLGAIEALDRLLARMDDEDLVTLARADALEAWRVLHGEPRLGRELSTERLFNEAGLERAISWSKGCYPGQEPVVMARHRGRPPHRLVCMDVQAEGATPGRALLREGRAAGQLASVARLPDGQTVALGFVRTSEPEDALVFEVEGGGEAVARP